METTPASSKSNPHGLSRRALAFMIVTGLMSSIGYGIINPIAPFLVSRYVSDPTQVGSAVGWLSSVYALCAFLGAPALGAFSDRFGRRPILLLCMAGTAVGFLCFGLGGALWVLFTGRIIDGLTGGNQGVMFAFVADLLPSDQRSRYFGIIGAVSGVGFILGPVIGGLLARISYELPFYLAAAVTAANVAYGLFFMPESLAPEKRAARVRPADLNPLAVLSGVLTIPQTRWLLMATFLYSLPFAALGANLSLFIKDSLNWSPDTIGLIFTLVGITDIFVQGVLLQWLIKRLSGERIAISGLCCELLGYGLIGTVAMLHSAAPLIAGTVLFAMGDGLLGPSLGGLLSQAVDERSQGTIQGGSQSIQSIARIAGPPLGGILYDRIGYAAPYIAGAAITGLAAWAVGAAVGSRPKPGREMADG